MSTPLPCPALELDGRTPLRHPRRAPTPGRSRRLGQILDRAVALELLVQNPARTLKPPRHTPRPVAPATPEEIEAMRPWFLERGRIGDAALVSVLAYVGPRPMEALALSWPEIDRDRVIINRALSDGSLQGDQDGGSAESLKSPAGRQGSARVANRDRPTAGSNLAT